MSKPSQRLAFTPLAASDQPSAAFSSDTAVNLVAWKNLLEKHVAVETPEEKLQKQQAQQLLVQSQQAYQDGFAQAKTVVDKLLKQYSQTIAQLVSARHQLLLDCQEELLELCVYCLTILLVEVPEIGREFTKKMLHHCSALLKDCDQFTLWLHPIDLQVLERYQPHLFAGQAIKCCSDESLQLGGIRVQSELGYIDASLQHRLVSLIRQLRANAD